MDNIVQKIKKLLLELFFPSFCLGCKKEGAFLCQDCKATLEISEYHYCLCENRPVRLPPGTRGGKCSRCQDKKLSGLYFCLAYKEKALIRKLIHQFKYDPYLRNLAKVLADIFITHIALAKSTDPDIWENSVLIPIPLEKRKLKSRGYNQSELFAREISRILPVPVMANNLVKIRKTAPQMKLSGKERAKNLDGAFVIKNPALLAGKKVFLVDDVYTTGSTMTECANVLRTSGARSVWGICITRDG